MLRLGLTELVIIVILILLLFGIGLIARLMHDQAKALRDARAEMDDDRKRLRDRNED